ncbi:replicative DNA helicase [Streptomyces sp. WMMC500]|uniref:replicative DNA helicase n=1 Tax=Streptomyces sp. WMMC500 TaxID=3015154 RepID=UPI00248AB58C|nr:replicative DNA helicase [Streptomyces sp. WMMC500]WBB64555.1 replicative DNA helicase [Streptomyces sp. WMMC500]
MPGDVRPLRREADRPAPEDPWGSGAPAAFERVPPQDLDAEQSVLGGMLLSKDAIADVVEVLKGHDFYRPAHETVYTAILDLYARGEPADPITVSAELTKRGELARVGGASYLHTLVQSVPTAANAEYYAEIVHQRAILRRLVEAGTRITQMGYAADGEVDDIVNSAQAEIYAVTEQRTAEDYLPLGEIMEGALDEIEAIGSRSGQMSGVPTGFTDLDSLTNGLHPGQMIVVAARPAMGKALALDTPLPTPTGWTTMGEVRPGDLLVAADGSPTRVVAATEVMTGRPCYEVAFDDGTTIVADADHQWLTDTRASRRSGRTPAAVRTTKEIAETLRCTSLADNRLNHSVPTTAPLALPARRLPVEPYDLGARLGAGTSTGAAEKPHIPRDYLRGSAEQRRHLLAGLLDSAGTITRSGAVRFAVTDGTLAEDFRELATSLGHRCRTTTKRAAAARTDRTSTVHVISFTTAEDVFLLEHKQRAHAARRKQTTARRARRFVTDVREVPSVPVRCVQVEHPDRLYLASRSMVPTHNSTLALDFARACSIKNNLPSVIFSLEMGRNEIAMRLLSAEARVALHHMRSGSMTDDDWTRLARRMPEVTGAPLYIDDSPNLSMMEIRAKCRRLKQRNDLHMIVIDYLQLMQTGGSRRPESRQQEVSEMSRNLKLLAKELEVPVIALSQLNRGPEQRTDKKPMVSDLRESGCVTASTRVLRADTGNEVTIGELLAGGEKDIPVWSLDEQLRLVPRTMTHVFSSGVKETFRLRLASGREIEATANHPFLTYDGWTPLGELAPGSRIATPRRLDAPVQQKAWPEAEVVMLAHLIGDGCVAPRQPLHYTSNDEANLTAVEEAATHFGITPRRVAQGTWSHVYLPAPFRLARGRRSPLAAWLDGMGLYGKRAHEKFLPRELFALPDEQVRFFLRHLWATDGSVTVSGSGAVRVYYATTSERLARDLHHLLLRLDIRARLRAVGNTTGRPGWTVDISGVDDQRRFLRDVGVHGDRSRHVVSAVERLRHVRANPNLDTVPRDVWEQVREQLREQSLTTRAFQSALGTRYCGSALYKRSPGRVRLGRIAEVLQSADLEMLATSDVFWDEVVSIENLGEQEVYDATVLGTHNFIANGISVHNSIEQDADMVILLHREDAYEKESPRAGEADLIVAKHRNGPTATITVAFQGHYSRFVDMAQT